MAVCFMSRLTNNILESVDLLRNVCVYMCACVCVCVCVRLRMILIWVGGIQRIRSHVRVVERGGMGEGIVSKRQTTSIARAIH